MLCVIFISKTYSVDYQTPDSANTATAILSGVKTRKYMIGVSARARVGNCLTQEGNELETVIDWAHMAGKPAL